MLCSSEKKASKVESFRHLSTLPATSEIPFHLVTYNNLISNTCWTIHRQDKAVCGEQKERKVKKKSWNCRLSLNIVSTIIANDESTFLSIQFEFDRILLSFPTIRQSNSRKTKSKKGMQYFFYFFYYFFQLLFFCVIWGPSLSFSRVTRRLVNSHQWHVFCESSDALELRLSALTLLRCRNLIWIVLIKRLINCQLCFRQLISPRWLARERQLTEEL